MYYFTINHSRSSPDGNTLFVLGFSGDGGGEGGRGELGGAGLNVFAHSLPYRIESLSAQ